jgi:hypothetical protein
MWLPSITFGMSCTTMTHSQLDSIQRPMINAILPKMGYSSKTSRHVVFGPHKYLGIGLRHLGPEQGVQQCLLFLKTIRSELEFSKLIRIGLSWFQLESGISVPILECPTLDIPYLEDGWFKMLREFLQSINAEIHIEMTHISKPLREGDSLIMEDFMAMQHYSPLELYRLNLCRKYLNVACLSEICNTTGNELLREPWQGRRPVDSESALYWPNQACPHEPSWNAWRCALKLAYLGPEIVRATRNRNTLPLNCPLGAWIGEQH